MKKAKRGTRAVYKGEPVTILEYVPARGGYWVLGRRGPYLARNDDNITIDWASEPTAKSKKGPK